MAKKMNKQEIIEFYSKIHKSYDDQWFNKSNKEVIIKLIDSDFFGRIKLNAKSKIIDYGGGSGIISNFIYEYLKLDNEVLCMDPSQEMINLAVQKKGVKGAVFDSSTISIEKNSIPESYKKVDVIFLMSCANLIKTVDRKRIFNFLKSLLKPRGYIVVNMRPGYTYNLPFPQFIQEMDLGPGPIKTFHEVSDFCNLKAEANIFQNEVITSKESWYNFLRKKIYTFLAEIPDEKIEEGIRELEKKYKDQQMLKFNDISFNIFFSEKQFIQKIIIQFRLTFFQNHNFNLF